ncbi:MAG: hypothetical protein ACOCWH_01245 [Spirochaetota bacterium]
MFPRIFGRTRLGSIAGCNIFCLVFFGAICPFFFGLSSDLTGNYPLPAGSCIGICIFLFVGSLNSVSKQTLPRRKFNLSSNNQFCRSQGSGLNREVPLI